MEKAIQILTEFGMIGYHDSLVQYMNYAILLAEEGEPETAMAGLDKIEPYVRSEGEVSLDLGEFWQVKGTIYLYLKQQQQCSDCLRHALEVYQTVLGDNSEALADKRMEIAMQCAAGGISIE
jgi:hypothetical protein